MLSSIDQGSPLKEAWETLVFLGTTIVPEILYGILSGDFLVAYLKTTSQFFEESFSGGMMTLFAPLFLLRLLVFWLLGLKYLHDPLFKVLNGKYLSFSKYHLFPDSGRVMEYYALLAPTLVSRNWYFKFLKATTTPDEVLAKLKTRELKILWAHRATGLISIVFFTALVIYFFETAEFQKAVWENLMEKFTF